MPALEDGVAVVTGAASGIGREIAIEFAESDATVVVSDVDAEGGEDAVEAIRDRGGEASFVEADVTEMADVERLVETVDERYGRLDCAVNNAGYGSERSATHEQTPESWHRVVDVHLTGVWRCLRHELAYMLDHGGGAVVNTGSVLGLVGTPMTAAYTAAKHGVLGLTKTAALEYAEEGIRVNAVCPGYIETETMLNEVGLDEDPALRAEFEGRHAMNRLGLPDEIAAATVWLCSDDASFVTGQSLAVDGGYTSQ